MRKTIYLRIAYVVILIFLLSTFAFSVEKKIGRQFSHAYTGNPQEFEIECNDETIVRLEVVVYLSNAAADPSFRIEIETFDISNASAGSASASLVIGDPFANVGGDMVRVIRTHAPGEHDRFSISIMLLSYIDWTTVCGINPPDANYKKRIKVQMGSLSNGHLQAYVHSDAGILNPTPPPTCVFTPSYTDQVSFIDDVVDPAEKKSIDTVLVLDVSGSMRGRASSDAGAPRKIDILHEGTQDFLDVWAAPGMFKPDDHIGAVFFTTSASKYYSGGNFLIPFTTTPTTDTHWGNVYSEVYTHTAGGTTAMGDGLQEALDGFDDTTDNNRYIILFTNGMQNTGNLVGDSGSPDYLKMLNGVSLRSYGVPIYTIGTGVATGSVYHDLLEAIAEQTGALSEFTTEMISSYDPTLFTNLVGIMRGNSPAIVGIDSGIVNNGDGEISHTYQVNKAAKSGIFIVAWHAYEAVDRNKDAIKLEVTGPNTIGTIPGTLGVKRSTNHSHIHSVHFPLNGFPAGEHEGTWTIKVIENLEGVKAYYHAALIVDEAELNYRVGATPRDCGTGEDILLTASLSVDGDPVTNAKSVLCTVTRPRFGLGSFLNQRNISDSQLNTNPPGIDVDNFPNVYSRKLYRLIELQGLGKLLEPIVDPAVELFDDGDEELHGDKLADDGIYSALYKNTQIPGKYELDFSIEGQHHLIGKFVRSEESTALVGVKNIDAGESELYHDRLSGGVKLLTFVPADKFGNYLGPGYGDKISIVSSAGNVSLIKDERENGTYTAYLSNIPGGTDPVITITVHGKEVVKKKLSKFTISKRVIFGLYQGSNIPHDTLAQQYNSGMSLSAMLEYLLSHRFSVFLSAGYDRFLPDQKEIITNDLDVFNISGNLKFYPVVGTFQMAVFGGLGFYMATPGDDKGGANFGTATEYRLNTRLSIELKYNYHWVFNDIIKFSTVQLGFRYRL